MSETMVDVLIYLYENYMGGEDQPPVEPSALEDELTQAGFSPGEVTKALRWLDELARVVGSVVETAPSAGSMRIYDERECTKLDREVRGMLLTLEQDGILDPVSRELVIDRLLAIDHPRVLVEEAQWVTLLVLMNCPGRESAFSQLEAMLYTEDSGSPALH